jgi:universal stress protein E
VYRFRVILVPVRKLNVRRSVIVERAAQIAAGSGARLELFHDLSKPVYIDTVYGSGKSLDALTRAMRATALQALERLAEPLRARGLKVTTAAVWDFPPYEAVVRRALAIGADLIVAPKRGHHQMKALLGYTDWELLRASPVPLLLIKTARLRARAPVLAAIDPLHARARPAPLEQQILRNAGALAAALGAPVHAVQVEAPWAPLGKNGRKGLVRHARIAGIQPRRVHLLEGDPDLLLPAAVRRLRASAVVMGAMSRRGLKRLFLGNTAERLLDDLRCDVLVVKPPRFAGRMPRARRGVFFLSNLPGP